MPNTTNTTLPFDRSHAFLIGINEYEELTSLKTAVNDAREIADILSEHHDFTVHGPLYNPNKDEMMRYLEITMMSEVKENDRVFIYFAGHGIALDSDGAGPEGYLVPSDAEKGEVDTLLAMDKVHELISKLPCRHGLLVFDCCFAGAFKWSSGYRDIVFDIPNVIYEERLYQYTQDPAWQVITSSACDQKAVDIMANRTIGLRQEDDGYPNSPFAQALMDGLMGAADVVPSTGGDGVITTSELYTYLRDRVEDETTEHAKRQTPSMFNLGRHDKGQFIFLHPKHHLNLPPMPNRNPFMGLQSYNEEDHLFFYGRDRVVEALSAKMLDQPFTVVSGASGTGKSSVIKAGLIPLMRKQGWTILPTLRPGHEPMDALAKEIPDIQSYMDNFQPALLVIDQYEELITQCLQTEERQAFEETLVAWMKRYPLLRIVVSIRSDFEPQFAQTVLEPWWNKGKYIVPRFSSLELKEVILKPTLQEVLFFDPPELVDVLINEVNQAPGALPLLSFTLSELYHAYLSSGRTNRSLTLEDYEQLGGVIGAMSVRANSIYDDFDADYQRSMRKLMLKMVYFDGEKNASRRVLEHQLIFSDEMESKRSKEIAIELVEARLLSTGIDDDAQIYYEPAHDALIHSWLRLQEWILSVGKSKLIMMYKLSLALADYNVHLGTKKAKEYLWNQNPRLVEVNADLKSGDHNLNAEEEAFVNHSNRLRRKKDISKKLLVGSLLTAFLVAFGLSISQWMSLKNEREILIESEQKTMSSRVKLMINEDLNIARVAASKAHDVDSTSVLAHQSLLQTVYVSPKTNCSYMKVQSGSKTCEETKSIIHDLESELMFVRKWGDHQFVMLSEDSIELFPQAQEEMIQARFSMDCMHLIVLSQRGKVYIYNDRGQLESQIVESAKRFKDAFLSPDNRSLLCITKSGKLRLFSFEGKAKAHMSAVSPCLQACFSSDGNAILSIHKDKEIRMWQIHKQEQQQEGTYTISLPRFNTPVWRIPESFSPDFVAYTHAVYAPKYDLVICSYADNSIRIWNKFGEEIVAFSSEQNKIREIRLDIGQRFFTTVDESFGPKTWPVSPEALYHELEQRGQHPLSLVEQITYLNYHSDQLEIDSWSQDEIIHAMRYLIKRERYEEAENFSHWLDDTSKLRGEEEFLLAKKGHWDWLPSLKKRSKHVYRTGTPSLAEHGDLSRHSLSAPTILEQ